MRRTIVISPDGTETVWAEGDRLPGYQDMRKIVDGYIETVRVLRRDITDKFVYTYMIVNEESRKKNLPINETATAIYMENAKRQYPDADDPYRAMKEAANAKYKAMGIKVMDLDPVEGPIHIHGTVIYFDGWTIDELVEEGL